MAKIGDIEFNLISESRNFNNEVTSHPVEDQSDIADHVRQEPISFSIEGVVTGDQAGQIHAGLARIRNRGEVVKYVGRAMINNCVIESFTSDVDETISNGFTFSMTIQEIEIAKPSTVGLLPATLRADTSEIGNAGRVQTQ